VREGGLISKKTHMHLNSKTYNGDKQIFCKRQCIQITVYFEVSKQVTAQSKQSYLLSTNGRSNKTRFLTINRTTVERDIFDVYLSSAPMPNTRKYLKYIVHR